MDCWLRDFQRKFFDESRPTHPPKYLRNLPGGASTWIFQLAITARSLLPKSQETFEG
jgi:hypothetical protein